MHQCNQCNKHFSKADSHVRHNAFSCPIGSMKKADKVSNGIFMNYTPEAKLKAGFSITKAARDNDNCFGDDFIDVEISEATYDSDEKDNN